MKRAETARPKLRRDAQRNREHILESATIVFGERGREATLNDIAAHAELGVGTVYRHFPNKDALLGELLEPRFEALLAVAEDASTGADAWAGLVALLEFLGRLCAEDRGLIDVFVHAEGGQDRVQALSKQMESPVFLIVERAKEQGRLRADFDAADIGLITTMLAAVIEESHSVAPELWRRCLTLIVDGLQVSRRKTTPLRFPALHPSARNAG
jgi:AcrR family transcriptional regulator